MSYALTSWECLPFYRHKQPSSSRHMSILITIQTYIRHVHTKEHISNTKNLQDKIPYHLLILYII